MHNDKTIDINLDYQRLQGKSYNIDFIQIKTDKVSDEEVKVILPSEKQTTKQLAEKAREESNTEEKASYKEDNTDDSDIKQLLDALDGAAKPMSERQIYVGCVLSDVKDRLQEMKDMKGEDYAVSYMKEHWPKINLAKVL